MSKKVKIKELNEESDIGGQNKDLTKISIDDLSTETHIEVPNLDNLSFESVEEVIEPLKPKQPLVNESSEKRVPKVDVQIKKTIVETRVEVINDQVTFKRNQLNTYFFKALSFAFILLVLDLTLHFLKFLDGKDVLTLESFDSFYFNNDHLLNLVKIISFLLIVHWMSPKGNIVVNRRGIYCSHVMVMNLFFTSSKIFLPWDDIKVAKYKVRFFEPYLFFYGHDNVELGQVDFSIDNRKDFFKFIEKNAGKNHPMSLVQKEIDSF